MKPFYTIGLLIISNMFMTFAWYGHLKMKQEFQWFAELPLIGVVAFIENGGPFTLMQLKVIQEVITLIVFTVFTTVFFKGEALHWNHLAAFVCLVLAVYFVFMK